uniref:Uncharacterized protein n=1 Tax=Arundo donax TaxID=35708 RepID=A0A0A9GVS7_ARUDO
MHKNAIFPFLVSVLGVVPELSN